MRHKNRTYTEEQVFEAIRARYESKVALYRERCDGVSDEEVMGALKTYSSVEERRVRKLVAALIESGRIVLVRQDEVRAHVEVIGGTFSRTRKTKFTPGYTVLVVRPS